MGTVYRCLSPDGQHVAVKVVRRGLDSARTLARFELERQTLSAFAHPNIAAVREAGTTSDGRPYFAMEYVAGSPITRYASAHDLDVAACARLVAAVCDGVQHAHERGVLHRDLKPSNVLVTAGADGLPVPKIIDFGLARAVDVAAASRPFLTTRGVVLGTPEYMSPEQAAAGAEAVDVRSDVYAIGLMLYETCARAHPYIDLPNLGPVELLRRIVEATPVVPSFRACDPERAAALRPHLDAVILRAIDKLPAERYASAADLARDLRA
jgi:serine/threonine protein kinase